MKYIVYILLFFPVWVTAQTYKYIGIEDGLSNRRIFNIQKDAQGYMWFLTNEGVMSYKPEEVNQLLMPFPYLKIFFVLTLGNKLLNPTLKTDSRLLIRVCPTLKTTESVVSCLPEQKFIN